MTSSVTFFSFKKLGLITDSKILEIALTLGHKLFYPIERIINRKTSDILSQNFVWISKHSKEGESCMLIKSKKVGLLKNLHNASRSNLFSVEIPKSTKEEGKQIEELVGELQGEGKIKVREMTQRKDCVYLTGILKYASE